MHKTIMADNAESQSTFASSVSQAASQSLGFSSGGNPPATASNTASPKAEAPRAVPSRILLVLPLPITKSSGAPHCAALRPAAAALQQHGASALSALLLNALPLRSHAVEACLGPEGRRSGEAEEGEEEEAAAMDRKRRGRGKREGLAWRVKSG
uniref:Uncharacterized protein n=1 Tax=Arundo donax TaxID=35708 RepID=A0A0A8ZS11_ARUDO